MAKADWRRDRRAIFKAAALLLILSLILTLLVSFLSERFTLMMVNISNELNSKPEMLLNPTEEFANEVFNELSAAFSTFTPASIVLITVIQLMQAFLNVGFEGYCLRASRKQEQKARDIMCSFEHFGKVLAMLIIRSAAVAVGSVFFVFPGIIAYYAFSQCFMIMYDHPEYSALRCLSESAKLMRGHKMMFFVLQFSFILWRFLENIVMQLTVVNLLMLYTRPYIGLSQAHFYNLLSRPEMYTPQQETQQ